ncbi:MAG: FkbM family methyltransferase [Roseicyclus sp.]|uniref:FkbM family methyltransferase n=1 Tax=Roseicyclus sp. TaxID=1914329 RepID=UPI003A88763E
MTTAPLAHFARHDLWPIGPVEGLFAAGSDLPMALGAICFRKLKRRLMARAEERFDALAAALGPGDIALDLGANVGDMTAKLAATGAEVHAFEPEPATFALLAERFAGQANVHLHQAAVSDRDGTTTLILPASFAERPRSASKAASIAHGRYAVAGHIAHEVETRDIRAILAGLTKPPRLIKMDIEGAELAVLAAMRAAGCFHDGLAVFVETHERLDPATYADVRALTLWARTAAPGYVNLNWG